jgi:Putative beta-barrel porin 2
MKGRIWMLGGACVLVLIVARAQYDVDSAAGPAPSPAPSPAAVDESQATSVVTPTSDAQINAAGQPITPLPPGQTQPASEAVSEEAVAADAAIVPEEPSRKYWRLVPLASVGVVYDDNIFGTNTDRVADIIWTLSAGVAFELGDFREQTENYVTAHWLGIPVIYMDNPEQNAFNQSAALAVQYRWNRLVAKIESNFDQTQGPNREVNTITRTTTFSNFLRFRYDYSEKTSFDLGFYQRATLVEGFENTNEYELRAGMDYQLFPKTRVGFEGVGGVTDQSSTLPAYYQQARVRVNYLATGKLAFKFNGGIEVREYEGSDIVKVNPIFRLGLAYQPFDGTNLSIVGYRTVSASNAVAGQDITATGFEIAAEQRLFQKFIAAISFGYENDVYSSTGNEALTDRVDNYVYARPRLRYTFIEWLSVSVFYEFRQTVSNQTTSSFYDNRVGMEIATRF